VTPLPPLALTYHGVAPVPLREDPEYLFTSPAALTRHVRTLRRWSYRLVGYRELCEAVAEGRAAGLASLTFDDGFEDNLRVLAPLLRDLGAPGTTFVMTGLLGEPHPYAPRHARVCTAEEVRALHAAGIELGAHTRSHPRLTDLPEAEQLAELKGSKDDLEDLVQAEVATAAYPYGAADDATRRAARDAGLRFACRTMGDGRWDDPFDQPRQSMRNGATGLGLRLKRDDRYEPLMRRREGRAVRRAIEHLRGRPLR
jgi:peptidoglycan/xylan/chitin deacetylase (PgdA/CDA1 family)